MNIDYLLQYLLNEDNHFSDYDVPQNPDEKRRLFRSLVNVREPKPTSREFLTVQDALLQAEIREKGVTDIDDLRPIHDNIYLWRGDITTLKAGAIVNAANSGMLGCFAPCHACIDNAIHTFAGVQLRLECAEIMNRQGNSEPTGKAKITAAYNLPCEYILHTVGPIIGSNVTKNDERLLASCYTSCLELAGQNRIENVAFCCISTGEFHFPNEAAAKIAVETVTAYLKNNGKVKRVLFDVFTERDERIYKELLGERPASR
jgi:O-acetyl-ADP-ribose deacetylase (regulator of RNase III)